jgi:hypothetical protein
MMTQHDITARFSTTIRITTGLVGRTGSFLCTFQGVESLVKNPSLTMHNNEP